MKPQLLLVTALIFVLATTPGCRNPAPAAPPRPLTVAAAAQLTPAFTELGQLFEQQTGHRVVFSFGSSGNLAQQIAHGAPFDLFASANVGFVDDLVAQGLAIAETKAVYATGRIVLASGGTAALTATAPSDLLDPRLRHVAIANPAHAPYGLAAQQALVRAGIWEAIQPKLVFGENISQTLQFVETGNADAGIVALALTIVDVPGISYVLLDADLHEPLEQALVVVQSSPHAAAARQFAAFVTGAEGRAIMARYGYGIPEGR